MSNYCLAELSKCPDSFLVMVAIGEIEHVLCLFGEGWVNNVKRGEEHSQIRVDFLRMSTLNLQGNLSMQNSSGKFQHNSNWPGIGIKSASASAL